MSALAPDIAALDRLAAELRASGAPGTRVDETRIHKFERAGLGRAPFYYIGSETKTFVPAPGEMPRAGSSCDYCSTSIAIVHWIQGSAPGDKRFKVGSDCVEKMGGAGLRVAVESAERKMAREKRRLRARAVADDVRDSLARPDVRAALASQPHPKGFRNRDTGAPLTLLDWAEWMLANAGTRGRAAVRTAIKQAVP